MELSDEHRTDVANGYNSVGGGHWPHTDPSTELFRRMLLALQQQQRELREPRPVMPGMWPVTNEQRESWEKRDSDIRFRAFLEGRKVIANPFVGNYNWDVINQNYAIEQRDAEERWMRMSPGQQMLAEGLNFVIWTIATDGLFRLAPFRFTRTTTLPQFSIRRPNSAAAGDLGELGAYGENIANNPTAARLHRRLVEGGYQHELDFGPILTTDDGLVIYGQHTRVPHRITVFAHAHDDGTAILGTFGHEARHGVDALRRMPLGTRWSEFRAHLQDFVITRGRYPTTTEAQDLASQVMQNYRHLPADRMDGLLRQIAVTGCGK